MKLLAEQCTSITITNLQREIRRLIDRDYPESTEQKIFDSTQKELAKFQVNDQVFEYTFLKNS